jgi:hypothetical protein
MASADRTDPQEFSNSNHSLSPGTSPNVSLEQQEPLRHRESTPDHEIPPSAHTEEI